MDPLTQGLLGGVAAQLVCGRTLPRTAWLVGFVAGTTADITVLRDGRELTFTATLAKRPSEEELATYEGSTPEADQEQAAAFLGIAVAPITAVVARQLGLNSTDGVVIMDVTAGSRGDRAGLAEGDVILEVDHQPIASLDDWEAAIAGIDEGEQVTLTILRNGSLRFVTIH